VYRYRRINIYGLVTLRASAMDVISACADRRDTIVVKDIQKRFQPVHICMYYYVTRAYDNTAVIIPNAKPK